MRKVLAGWIQMVEQERTFARWLGSSEGSRGGSSAPRNMPRMRSMIDSTSKVRGFQPPERFWGGSMRI